MSDTDEFLHGYEEDAFDPDSLELPVPLTDQIISAIKLESEFIPEGASVSSAAAHGFRTLVRASFPRPDVFESGLICEAGDFSVGNDSQRVNSTAPSTTDVWFLHVGLTILPPWSYTDQGSWYANQSKSDGVLKLLAPILGKCGNISVLRMPRTISDITSQANVGIDVVKEARFENYYNQFGGARWPSEGPCGLTAQGIHSSPSVNLVGYIAFPVGPIEAMRSIFLVVEDITDQMKGAHPWSTEYEVYTTSGSTSVFGGWMPPLVENDTGYGLPISVKNSMERSPFIEYPAVDFAGLPRHKAHQWLRYYFRDSDFFPTPGKFIGITVKPQTLSPWFYQRTSPVLYSGCFFETKSYTTGIITAILDDDDKLYGEVGSVYCVNIRGVSVYIEASDFLTYSIGEEVAVLKCFEDHDLSSPFTWLELDDIQLMVDALKESYPNNNYVLFRNYQIVPVTFYQNC